jgi:hypothetical protein
MLARPGIMKSSSSSSSIHVGSQNQGLLSRRSSSPDGRKTAGDRLTPQRKEEDVDDDDDEAREQKAKQQPPRRIFDGVVVYVNGSTHPLISDHKLRHVLAEHGATMSSHLGRRKVTHVILGRSAAGGYGSGGGLAGAKLQREVSKIGGPAVKFVGVQWVLESIKVGKRLPEARFADLKIASRCQQSVYGLYSRHEENTSSASVDESRPLPSGQSLR